MTQIQKQHTHIFQNGQHIAISDINEDFVKRVGMEIGIENGKQSRTLQKRLFELGFEWLDSGTQLKSYRKGSIVIGENKKLEHYTD